MRLNIFQIFVMFVLFHSSNATPDSVRRKQSLLVMTPRFNTLNMAPVSGNIINRHVNLDLTIVYTNNRFMWTTANAIDFEDWHSEMNYFLTNVRYKISLGKNFGISPFLAFYSEHAQQLFDPVSDANGGMIFSYRHKLITVEAFILFVRLTHSAREKDIINRFEIRCNLSSIVLSGFVYQNTGYFDGRERIAVGFKATLAELTLFNTVRTRSEVTGSFKIRENPETKNLDGVFLSLAFPFNL